MRFQTIVLARVRAMVAVALLLAARGALAANPAPVQLFYVPFPEAQLLQGLQAIESGGSGDAPVDPMQTYISIAAVANNTIVYYDQWENGYDADIANPLNLYSGGNPGGTQIWGDANAANGAPPGIPGDVINAGTVIVLNNAVTSTSPLTIDFDGRDKIAATKTVALTHVGWATDSDTLLAGAVEVFDTDSWGTSYIVPVGQNIATATDHQMFEYTALVIMAGEGSATIQIDADADGIFETMQVLAEGESFFVNGGVNVGARVTSDNPVQVDILTGDVGSNYESRDSSLLPTNLWTDSAYTPVSTPETAQSVLGTATTVWLYNPGATSLTVQYTTRDGGGNLTTTPLSVPGGPAGGFLPQVIPDGFGAHFATAGAPFYAFSTTNSTDTATSGNQAWDWGFTLVPEDSLTPQVLIGLGIGRDPTSGTNPNENGNPIWVTPIGNGDTFVTVYVDFDADPLTGALTDPNGNKYDVALSLRELDRAKVYDTGDRNQTGTLIYTLANGVKLAAAWGQDPTTASASSPGLDVGTGIPPLPLFAAGKNGTLDVDNDGDGFVSPGDVLLYTITLPNISRAPVPDLLLEDTIPAGTTYVPNSTFFTNASSVTTPISDDGMGMAFPLDGDGVVLDPITALPVGGTYTVTFRVTINSFANLPPGTTEILNVCSASAVGTTVPCSDTTTIFGCIGDFVWLDLDSNGLQDGGPETGIPGVTLELYLDANGSGTIDMGDSVIDSEATNGSGNYLFTGVPAGTYIVDVVDSSVPAGHVLTTANDPLAITLAGGECRFDADFGYRPPTTTTTSTSTTTTTSTTSTTTTTTTSTTTTTTSTTTSTTETSTTTTSTTTSLPDTTTTTTVSSTTTTTTATCVPTGPENTSAACSNMLDDDCDTLIDCLDPDCFLVDPCPPAKKDPTDIRFQDGMDRVRSKAVLEEIDAPGLTAINLCTVDVGILISNPTGNVYSVMIPGSSLTPSCSSGKTFRYRNVAARTDPNGGLYELKIKKQRGDAGYAFSTISYADMSATDGPTGPPQNLEQMRVQFYVGDRVFITIDTPWKRTPAGWKAPKDH